MSHRISQRCKSSGTFTAVSLIFAVAVNPAPTYADSNRGFSEHVMSMAKEREKVKNMEWNSPTKDSANTGSTSKSWTVSNLGDYEKPFLDSLKWKENRVGNYVLRTGWIFDKWIAATQFTRNGKHTLTEITPPYEYVIMVDPVTGLQKKEPTALDADHDGKLEIAFLHEKLNDPNYHMYTIYRLDDDSPHLIWKSGGELGDWVNGLARSKSAKVKLRTTN